MTLWAGLVVGQRVVARVAQYRHGGGLPQQHSGGHTNQRQTPHHCDYLKDHQAMTA